MRRIYQYDLPVNDTTQMRENDLQFDRTRPLLPTLLAILRVEV